MGYGMAVYGHSLVVFPVNCFLFSYLRQCTQTNMGVRARVGVGIRSRVGVRIRVRDSLTHTKLGHPEGKYRHPEGKCGHPEGKCGHPEGKCGHPRVSAGHGTGCSDARKFLDRWEIKCWKCRNAECVHGCMGVWVYGCMGAWVHGCMGVWVHGCMVYGVWVYGVWELVLICYQP